MKVPKLKFVHQDLIPKIDKQASGVLAEYLLLNLMPGMDASNKMVRYRVCQIILILLNHLDELELGFFLDYSYSSEMQLLFV